MSTNSSRVPSKGIKMHYITHNPSTDPDFEESPCSQHNYITSVWLSALTVIELRPVEKWTGRTWIAHRRLYHCCHSTLADV